MLSIPVRSSIGFTISIVILIMLCFVLFSCDHTTTTKTYRLSGFVSNITREGIEGATVLVYQYIPFRRIH